MLKRMPIILALLIILVLVCDPILSTTFKSVFYAISLTIKSILIFLLPIIIFGLLFKAAVNIARQSTRLILLIIGGICVSSYLATFLSHFVGSWVYHYDITLSVPKELTELLPYWNFELPKHIPNNVAMFSGLFLGIIFARYLPTIANTLSEKIDKVISKVLYGFVFLIPIFVAGFVVKMKHDGIIMSIVENYLVVFLLIAMAQFIYISFIYFSANRFHWRPTIRCIKNMLPAAITGFCTMSSATAMPLTLIGVEKNIHNPDLARSIVPATVNVHLIGDCFAIPIFAYAILKNFGFAEPSLLAYLIFAVYFVLAKFSVAAMPGGGVIVMLPILEASLGFNSEMLSLITALYVLFDPIITSANVFGNGSFALVISKIAARPFPRFKKKFPI